MKVAVDLRRPVERVAIDLVKDGQAQACVSAGNTGALMATARFVLKTLPGIDRPAIITAIPSIEGHTHMLDLGANSLDIVEIVTNTMRELKIKIPRDELAKISKEQKAGNWDVWQTSLHNPDFAGYANLCGALGLSARDGVTS